MVNRRYKMFIRSLGVTMSAIIALSAPSGMAFAGETDAPAAVAEVQPETKSSEAQTQSETAAPQPETAKQPETQTQSESASPQTEVKQPETQADANASKADTQPDASTDKSASQTEEKQTQKQPDAAQQTEEQQAQQTAQEEDTPAADSVSEDKTQNTEESEKQIQEYSLAVDHGVATVNGKAVTKAAAGDVVTIKADDVEGKGFKSWTVKSGKASLLSASSSETTFTMPDGSVSVSAVYEDSKATAPKLSLNGSPTRYFVGDDIFATLSGGSVSGVEKAVWTVTFPESAGFSGFLSGVSLASQSGARGVTVEVNEGGSWRTVDPVKYRGNGKATGVRITTVSVSGGNDMAATLGDIQFSFKASRANDPDSQNSGWLNVTSSVTGYTVADGTEHASVSANSNTIAPSVVYKESSGPSITTSKPDHNAIGGVIPTTLSGFKGNNVQKVTMTYEWPDNVSFGALKQTPGFSFGDEAGEADVKAEYKDAAGNWAAYTNSIDPSSVKGLRFTAENSGYGLTQSKDAVIDFKGEKAGTGTISVTTAADRFGASESFRTACEVTVDNTYVQQNVSFDGAPTELDENEETAVTGNVKFIGGLKTATIHVKPSGMTLSSLAVSGAEGATFTITHDGKATDLAPLSGTIDMSGYAEASDIAITISDVKEGTSVSIRASGKAGARELGTGPRYASVTLLTEANDGSETVRYTNSTKVPVTGFRLGTPVVTYSGGEVKFGKKAEVSFGGLSLEASKVSSDYVYTINTPPFTTLDRIVLPKVSIIGVEQLLNNGSPIRSSANVLPVKMDVSYTMAGGRTIDIGSHDSGSTVVIGRKVTSVTLRISGAFGESASDNTYISGRLRTEENGRLVLENGQMSNKTRTFTITAAASAAYHTEGEVVSKNSADTLVEFELYKEPDNNSQTHNSGSGNNGYVPVVPQPDASKTDNEKEAEPDENEEARKAQTAALERAAERGDLRGRIAQIRANALGLAGGADTMEDTAGSNAGRIAALKQKAAAHKGAEEARKASVANMTKTGDLNKVYKETGIYPIPEEIVGYNKSLLTYFKNGKWIQNENEKVKNFLKLPDKTSKASEKTAPKKGHDTEKT